MITARSTQEAGVFHHKNHGCGQKKQEGTSSAILGVWAAAKCCKLKRCADRVRSRTVNKGEVLEGKFRNFNFSPSSKKTTEISFQVFLSIYRYLIFFLKFITSKLSNNRLAALPRDFPPRKNNILFPRLGCLGTTLTLPQSLCDGRTYVQAHADVRTKFSCIDRLRNLLSNGAPLLILAG